MQNDSELPPTRTPRHGLRALLLLGFVGVLAAGWTIVWMRARDEVQSRFDALLVTEAKAGRQHQCLGRTIGGYPFHIEITCQSPILRASTIKGELAISAQQLKTVALVYAPNHIIAELEAPVIVRQGEQNVAQIGFSKGMFSFKHDFKGLERLSFEADDFVAAADATSPALSAKHVEFHVRPGAAEPADAGDTNLDVAFSATQALLPGAAPDQASDIRFDGSVEKIPQHLTTLAQSLDDWRTREGALKIRSLVLSRNGGQLTVSGDAHLNDTHQPEGRFLASIVNSPALLRGLVMNGKTDAGALFGPLLPLLGKPVIIDGQRASQLQMVMTNGSLTLGSLVLAEFAPLY